MGIHNPGYQQQQRWAGLFTAVGMGGPPDPTLQHRDTHPPWEPALPCSGGHWIQCPSSFPGWGSLSCLAVDAAVSWEMCAVPAPAAVPLMDNRSLRAGERHPVQTHQA